MTDPNDELYRRNFDGLGGHPACYRAWLMLKGPFLVVKDTKDAPFHGHAELREPFRRGPPTQEELATAVGRALSAPDDDEDAAKDCQATVACAYVDQGGDPSKFAQFETDFGALRGLLMGDLPPEYRTPMSTRAKLIVGGLLIVTLAAFIGIILALKS